MGNLVLSQSSSTGPSGAGSGQYLTFTLDDNLFAMDITAVREVIQMVEMTSVPLMPGFVRGVINLRGAVVPVIDLQERIGRGAGRIGKRTCIVILEVGRQVNGMPRAIGMMVDAVSEVLEIAAADIEPTPVLDPARQRELLAGVAKVAGHFVVLLDPTQAFQTEELGAIDAGMA